ncbi:hypothetical protein BKA83DRAFT_4342367 [Pisolithus microcarpus]|nr:hypothetical protein BKA83DRAFT_4342367 [Pisolithus microcarpus]
MDTSLHFLQFLGASLCSFLVLRLAYSSAHTTPEIRDSLPNWVGCFGGGHPGHKVVHGILLPNRPVLKAHLPYDR